MFRELFRRMPDIRAVGEPAGCSPTSSTGSSTCRRRGRPRPLPEPAPRSLPRCPRSDVSRSRPSLLVGCSGRGCSDDGRAAARRPAVSRRSSGDADEGIDGVQAIRVYYDDPVHTESIVDYELRPPAGGIHNPVWWNCGFYDEAIPDENVVHDLEHGAVWLAYAPDLAGRRRRGDPRPRPRQREGHRGALPGPRRRGGGGGHRLGPPAPARLPSTTRAWPSSCRSTRTARRRPSRARSCTGGPRHADPLEDDRGPPGVEQRGVAEDLEPVVDGHAVPRPQQQVAGARRGARRRPWRGRARR